MKIDEIVFADDVMLLGECEEIDSGEENVLQTQTQDSTLLIQIIKTEPQFFL